MNIQISDLLSLIHVYIPIIKNAGVQSNGLVVSCDTYKSTDLNSGSAGGYIVCLPNRVVIQGEGDSDSQDSESGFDAVV